MAPKRHKKQKAKQVRHHLEVKRSGEHLADSAGDAERSTPVETPVAPAAVIVEERPPALDI